MSNHSYFSITAGIFGIIAVLHLFRIINSWEAVIGGVTIPLWASYVAVVVAGILAYHGFKKR